MIHVLGKSKASHFATSVNTVMDSFKKVILFSCGFVLILTLQVTFFSSQAIASPLAGIFGNKVEKITQGVKTDREIDKAAGITKAIGRDVRDSRTDKVIDKLADTSKDFAKEAGNRAKDLANSVKEGTKENIGKAKESAKDAKDKISGGIDRAKDMASDRTNEMKYGAKDLSDQAGSKVDEVIDSVKSFLGQ